MHAALVARCLPQSCLARFCCDTTLLARYTACTLHCLHAALLARCTACTLYYLHAALIALLWLHATLLAVSRSLLCTTQRRCMPCTLQLLNDAHVAHCTTCNDVLLARCTDCTLPATMLLGTILLQHYNACTIHLIAVARSFPWRTQRHFITITLH